MKTIRQTLTIHSLLVLIFAFFFCIGCEKSKDKTKEEKIKKEIIAYQKLDAQEIQKVYHTSEMEAFERGVKDKCKLLDLNISSFYTEGEGKKYTFLSIKEFKIDLIGEYKGIESFINYLKTRDKYIGIRNLTIESNQTGQHKASVHIEVLEKNYIDKDFLPSVINAMVGVSMESEDVLTANLKVFQSRYVLVKNLSSSETISWNNRLSCLYKIPEKCFIKKLQYLRTIHNEQLKIEVVTENNQETLKKVNSFFETSQDLKGGMKNFSKRDKPEELPSGLAGLAFIYDK